MRHQRVAYTSSEFFHFVGLAQPKDHEANYETLRKVLVAKNVSHFPHEPGWGSVGYCYNEQGRIENETLLTPRVTCYCDIPKAALGLHVSKYGAFGVGFPRGFVIKYGARPVMYVPFHPDDHLSPFGRQLVRSLEAAYRGFKTRIVDPLHGQPKQWNYTDLPSSDSEAVTRMSSILEKDVIAFLKPFDSNLPEEDPNNFYMEREWRKYGNLCFAESDVSSVVVASGWAARVKSDFPAYAAKIYAIDT